MRDGVPSCGTIEAGPRAGPRVGSRRARAASARCQGPVAPAGPESSRAGGEHLGGRPGKTQTHAEVRAPAELPAPAAATSDLPDRHAQAARLVGRLGEGAVRRGDNESGETGGDVRQVDEVQSAVAARAATKGGEVLSADDGAAGPEGATGCRKGEDGGGHGRFLS